MSRLIKCDECGEIVPAERSSLLGDDYSFIWLSVEANEDRDHGQFCSWICLGTFAMTKAMSANHAE